jgi:D-3-phosphoglycerate dehydrogenase
MITKFTREFGNEGINITDMANKSKGEYAYTIMDFEDAIKDETVKKLQEIEGVFRVRVVRKDL